MTSNEKEPARPVTGRRRPLGYRFWTGALLAVVGITLVLASSAGSFSQAEALRMLTIGVALELVSILLLFWAGTPRIAQRSGEGAEHARARIAKTMMITLMIGGAAMLLLPLITNQ
jgi:drug/metabolite transporter (DMT)-like permease